MKEPSLPASQADRQRTRWGAVFLMATSAIGPGFLNNTSLFTGQLLSSFGFVILISILIDIGAQLNIWRIITAGGKRAQDLAGAVMPGGGYLLAGMILFGGLAFNIGNLAGCGMGLRVLTGWDTNTGAVGSALLAGLLFWIPRAGRTMDTVVKYLGLAMLALTLYIMWQAKPPYLLAVQHSFWPQQTNIHLIITLVGGTVGGYISFAGAHRLLESGVSGAAHIPIVNRSAVNGILLTSLMRYVLFLAALGVVATGFTLDKSNPAASVFRQAAGEAGYYFFGLVLWMAAITSVIGASFTSVSFIKNLHPALAGREKELVSLFIAISLLVLIIAGKAPAEVLVMAGWVNGLVLPLALAMLLAALRRPGLFPAYRHPRWLEAAGWAVVALMGSMSLYSIWEKW